ncbi:MAG TPA: DUF4160 domain-containing protein [Phycisphaerales bacterium]
MPEVFRAGGWVYFFWSNEGHEPPHVHVRRGNNTGSVGKWWIAPTVRRASDGGFKKAELRVIEQTIVERRQEILDAWKKHFNT